MPSAARSRLLPEPWVFFLDRSMGSRLVADALRVRGEIVEAHDAHFAKDAADVEWLGAVGRKRWVVVSKDDRIRLNEVERMALTEAGVAAFFLGRSDLTGPQMASGDGLRRHMKGNALQRAHRRVLVYEIANFDHGAELKPGRSYRAFCQGMIIFVTFAVTGLCGIASATAGFPKNPADKPLSQERGPCVL